MPGTTLIDLKEEMARIEKHAGKICMKCKMRGSRCTWVPVDAVPGRRLALEMVGAIIIIKS